MDDNAGMSKTTTMQDEEIEQLSKFTKLIYPIYVLYGLASLILMILAIFVGDGWAFFLILLLATVIFSILGALGVWKWGTVQMEIDRLKGENDKYETELEQLAGTRKDLSGEVSTIHESAQSMQRDVDSLKQTLRQYDALRASLEEICGDNETINEMVNDLNGMYSSMKDTVFANIKAGLLSAYYEVALQDGSEDMNENEFRKFLGRLDKETRGRFGPFQEIAGDDNRINLDEFQRTVDQILMEREADFVGKQAKQSMA